MLRATMLIIFPVVLALPLPAQTVTGSIQGTVRKAGTNEPIPDVLVIIGIGRLPPPPVFGRSSSSSFGQTPFTSTTKTDAAGKFSFQNLSAGEYAVRAQREGYFGP